MHVDNGDDDLHRQSRCQLTSMCTSVKVTPTSISIDDARPRPWPTTGVNDWMMATTTMMTRCQRWRPSPPSAFTPTPTTTSMTSVNDEDGQRRQPGPPLPVLTTMTTTISTNDKVGQLATRRQRRWPPPPPALTNTTTTTQTPTTPTRSNDYSNDICHHHHCSRQPIPLTLTVPTQSHHWTSMPFNAGRRGPQRRP